MCIGRRALEVVEEFVLRYKVGFRVPVGLEVIRSIGRVSFSKTAGYRSMSSLEECDLSSGLLEPMEECSSSNLTYWGLFCKRMQPNESIE